MDKLERIFKEQEILDNSVQDNHGMRGMSVSEKLQKKSIALFVELGETLNELDYKWWKNPKQIDMDKVKEELIDVFHFFVSMCITAGMTADELFDVYMSKNAENHKRQVGASDKKGYDPREV